MRLKRWWLRVLYPEWCFEHDSARSAHWGCEGCEERAKERYRAEIERARAAYRGKA